MEEVQKLLSTLKIHSLQNILSNDWWNMIASQNKLSQQALSELCSGQEEIVLKGFLEQPKKVHVLINEILCLSTWRQEILPKILEGADKDWLENSYLLYIVLYHESVVVSLLEVLLFHGEMCASLEDSAIEMVDYCAAEITQLISNQPSGSQASLEILSTVDEIFSHSKNIRFGIGMRCITIIMYITENLDRLSLSVTSRLYTTHDFPLLMTNLVDKQPWLRIEKDSSKLQFTDGLWHPKSEGSLIGRHEANSWLAIHQMLLHPELGKHYQVTDYAKGQFMRLESRINDSMLSQLPPLQQLKHGILYMANFQMPVHRPPILLELIPQMKSTILEEGNQGWSKIIKIHKQRISECKNMSEIIERFANALQVEGAINLCTNCSRPAKSRCSKCKKAWYCGRDCQLQHFPHHKPKCIL